MDAVFRAARPAKPSVTLALIEPVARRSKRVGMGFVNPLNLVPQSYLAVGLDTSETARLRDRLLTILSVS